MASVLSAAKTLGEHEGTLRTIDDGVAYHLFAFDEDSSESEYAHHSHEGISQYDSHDAG